jgi:hypothetical protein
VRDREAKKQEEGLSIHWSSEGFAVVWLDEEGEEWSGVWRSSDGLKEGKKGYRGE